MIEEDDTKILYAWSYIENADLLKQIGLVHIIREEEFSKKELRKFRIDVQPLIKGGMVYRQIFEEGMHYYLTSFGEEVCEFLQPAHQQRQAS